MFLNQIKTCWNNTTNKLNAYRNGDPIMVKKSINGTVAAFKRSAPDKPYIEFTVKSDPEMTILDALVVGIIAAMALCTICVIFKLIFKKRW